jgi:PIN domain nuclease of toxin-antitoxin system
MHAEPGLLSSRTRRLLQEPRNQLLLSAASAWEIAIKFAIGKLDLPIPPSEYVASRLTRSGTDQLPITIDHALGVSQLPPHHRDPFDRLLIAQCQAESLVLLTSDRQLERYDIEIVWAT